MSAYVVNDDTVNSVVSWLSSEQFGNGITYGRATRIIKKLGFDPGSDDFGQKLGQAMFDLNCQAVNERYGPGEAEKFRPLDYAYQYKMTPNIFQILKSLHCWHYQCAEGKVPETELYKGFESIIHAIEGGIVNSLPQYEAAKWD